MKLHQNRDGTMWTQIYVGTEGGKRKYKRIYADKKEELTVKILECKIDARKQLDVTEMTLREGCTAYIELKRNILSESTLHRYEQYRDDAFQDIMDLPMKKITGDVLEVAVSREANRKPRRSKNETMAPKTLKNEYGFIREILSKYTPEIHRKHIELKKVPRSFPPLIPPEAIILAVKGKEIELAVLFAMWLSMTVSEIRGLTKSNSIDGDYLTIREVVITVDKKDIRKRIAKEETRNRRFLIPPYIRNLIDNLPADQDALVDMSRSTIYEKWKKALQDAGLPHVCFHELRHECASIMAMLRIPTKTACEIGGWSTPNVMQNVYTQVFDADREEANQKMNNYFESLLQQSATV